MKRSFEYSASLNRAVLNYAADIISFSWRDPFRDDRIALRSQPEHRLEDSIALQHHVQSMQARALVKLLPATLSPETGVLEVRR